MAGLDGVRNKTEPPLPNGSKTFLAADRRTPTASFENAGAQDTRRSLSAEWLSKWKLSSTPPRRGYGHAGSCPRVIPGGADQWPISALPI